MQKLVINLQFRHGQSTAWLFPHAAIKISNRITKPRINIAQALNLSATDSINCGAKCTIIINLVN